MIEYIKILKSVTIGERLKVGVTVSATVFNSVTVGNTLNTGVADGVTVSVSDTVPFN